MKMEGKSRMHLELGLVLLVAHGTFESRRRILRLDSLLARM
jgi:hypothetical protein